MKNISRRKFIGQLGCGAMGYATFYNTLINMKAINAAAIANSALDAAGDYKALVCLMLSGGNDSFNMLVPRDNASYQVYADTRSNLALPQQDLLALKGNNHGTQLGVHPSMGAVQQLFENNRLAFISNVGTLIQPTAKEDFYSYQQKLLPLGLFSHSDQSQQWQTAFPHERSSVGWGGKVADLINDMNTNKRISMNISLSGTNIFQTGKNTIEYAIDPYNGSVGIYGYGATDDWNVFDRMRTQAIDSMLEYNYQDIFKKTYTDVIRDSRDAHIEFESALGQSVLGSSFTDNYLSRSFEMIARTISVQQTLNVQRQIFFVDYGGWDHHDEVLQSQQDMLGVVSNALGEFNAALQEINMADQVTTFTISEFGRTLTSNGNGTDHAWGGNVMVMGGSVKGGQVYGTYPSLQLESDIEVGGGVLIPSTSADQYFAEMAMWFGVSPGDLNLIFPNLSNFYSGTGAPLGFLNQ